MSSYLESKKITRRNARLLDLQFIIVTHKPLVIIWLQSYHEMIYVTIRNDYFDSSVRGECKPKTIDDSHIRICDM